MGRRALISAVLAVLVGTELLTSVVSPLAGALCGLLGAAVLFIFTRGSRGATLAGGHLGADGVSEQQRRSLPPWYLERGIFPVPTWAWIVLAILVLVPYLLGQAHVLSQDHAGNWLVAGFVSGGLVLYLSGRLERRKAERESSN